MKTEKPLRNLEVVFFIEIGVNTGKRKPLDTNNPEPSFFKIVLLSLFK